MADAAARRPAYVTVLADRDGTDIVVHAAGDYVPARRFGEISAALDQISDAAIDAASDLIAAPAERPDPGAVRGIKAVAEQLAEQQVAALLRRGNAG